MDHKCEDASNGPEFDVSAISDYNFFGGKKTRPDISTFLGHHFSNFTSEVSLSLLFIEGRLPQLISRKSKWV